MDTIVAGFICTFAGLAAGLFIGLVCGVKLHVWSLRERRRRSAAIFHRYPIED